MDQDDVRDARTPVNESRRKLIKAAAVAGGAAVAVGALPGEWKKPLATVGGLPAHAQTSTSIIVVSNLALVDAAGFIIEMQLPLVIIEIPCTWTFQFIDPLCQVGPEVIVTGTLTMCGLTIPFTKTLLELSATIISGDSCGGTMQISYPAAACPDESTAGILEITLTKGTRTSNTISVAFDLNA